MFNNNKKYRYFLIALTIVLILLFISLFLPKDFLYVQFQSLVLDNEVNTIPCNKLPKITEVEKVINENRTVVEDIEALNPGISNVEANGTKCTNGNGDVRINVGGHNERVKVKQMRGNTFFGLPYEIINV